MLKYDPVRDAQIMMTGHGTHLRWQVATNQVYFRYVPYCLASSFKFQRWKRETWSGPTQQFLWTQFGQWKEILTPWAPCQWGQLFAWWGNPLIDLKNCVFSIMHQSKKVWEVSTEAQSFTSNFCSLGWNLARGRCYASEQGRGKLQGTLSRGWKYLDCLYASSCSSLVV